jgi:hypothetical protein
MSENVTGEVVKTVKKPEMEMDNYVEFWAKAGQTYKVVRVDD